MTAGSATGSRPSDSLSDSSLADFLADVPPFGDTAAAHLRHTLACLRSLPASHVVLPCPAEVTVGHLRALEDVLHGAVPGVSMGHLAALTAVTEAVVGAARGRNGFAVTATVGVFAGRTGLTWDDLATLVEAALDGASSGTSSSRTTSGSPATTAAALPPSAQASTVTAA